MSDILTQDDLSQWILRKLGSPLVNLDISNDQINDSISDAVRYFSYWSGTTQKMWGLTMQISAGVDTYDMSSVPGLIDIVSVDTSQSVTGGINTLFTLENQLYNEGALNFAQNFDLVSYEMALEYLEQFRQLYSVKIFLNYNPYTKILKILPKTTENMWGVLLCYLAPDSTTGTSNSIYNEIWVQRYALALCKIQLSYIYGKFNGIPLPGGGTINSDKYGSEGSTEKKELEEQLVNDYAEPFGFWLA